MMGVNMISERVFHVMYRIWSITVLMLLVPALWLLSLIRVWLGCVYHEEVAGKVVLITGASSGIGEQLAMEFAKEGACLALVARRKKQVEMVAQNAKAMGSPNVIAISADVSKHQDCNRFVRQTIKHFGRLDYLVNNAAIAKCGFFEDQTFMPDHTHVMDVNFWGSVYTTHFALPHLKRNHGKIIAICSCGSWFGTPRASVYNASKAALLSFFETLRIELDSEVDITIITPGAVKSNLMKEEWIEEAKAEWAPMLSVKRCAKGIVDSTRRGDKYFTEPSWMMTMFLWKTFCPQVHNFLVNLVFVAWPNISSQTPKLVHYFISDSGWDNDIS